MTNLDVSRLTGPQREGRVVALTERAYQILDRAIEVHAEGRRVVAEVVLFSGGNDSTTLAHLFRGRATHAAHANTTIGIEETRQFVRDTCDAWGLPLIEKLPPVTYQELVLERGFPGPGQHFKMYQRLKERCLRQVRADLIHDSRRERVVFIAGRRRDESARRADVPFYEREGSTVWASPLAEWTKLDLNTYRLMHTDVPRNKASDLLHMSGECLCGSFAKKGELDAIAEWFPIEPARIRELERRIADRADIPAARRKWGWGAYREAKPSKLGPLCTSCGVQGELFEAAA